ncbi:MAG: alpha-galactosidase [Lachnospiraceae bacterium]|jgi:alpha-galactosidase|nr:alpha-galactosidase [Lachnospiraceae bacterium]
MITYHEQERIFKLDTPNTSYLIGIVDEENFIGHIYYGKRLKDADASYLLRTEEPPFVPGKNNRERCSFYDCFPFEYPAGGIGDCREGCLGIRTAGGHTGAMLSYVSHEILEGKPELTGLPATFGTKKECTTLKLLCEDKYAGMQVELLYTVFQDTDAMTRSVKVTNVGREHFYLTKVFSASLDMDNRDFDMISLHGSWARERHIQRKTLGYGIQNVSSVRGESSHQDHPFLALVGKNTTQDSGEVYAMNFVYSGNFRAQAEVTQFDYVRMSMGIHPENFCWKLEAGESFQAPEVVMLYTDKGLDAMTNAFHTLYRKHLIRGEYRNKKRPILINNWEATYFDFDTEKLLSIAKEASKLGIEMLVMDDGWFGKRNNDDCALGDWQVNEEKLKGGLKYLVDEVNRLGMKFGIWFEPEMISPDSNLYREHPDWALAIPGRPAAQARQQFVLDLSRKEVVDHVYEMVASVLRSANIEYVKWDMNRPLADIGSIALPADRQGEICHRYMLAVYEMQSRLVKEFPHLLLENCSGGGARFDPGMLYYSPQIWCSDDADAIERLEIQEGTALLYPLSTMGAHVSDCPNHVVGRVTPFETRGIVALAGTFGYELDVTRIPEEDRNMIPEQVALYHQYNDLIREGDYYRIASYSQNHKFDCWQVVSENKEESLVTFVQVLCRANFKSRRLLLKGLAEDKRYEVRFVNDKEIQTKVYSGDTLMKAGLLIPSFQGDFQARLIHLVKCEEKF